MRIAELEALCSEDRLTGLTNRHGFFVKLPVAVSDLARMGNSSKISAFIIDLDHFKRINDTYGHDAGDQILAEFARRLSTFRKHRPSDIVCRWGGEEFLVILPGAGIEEAYKQAMLLASVVRNQTFTVQAAGKKVDLQITVSVGVAETEVVRRDTAETVWARLYVMSDKAVYRAKNGDGTKPGRDQVICHDSQP